MARPRTGKRASASNRMGEIKVGFTPSQHQALEQHRADNPGMSQRGAVRAIFNAGMKALGLMNLQPAIAGRIGIAPATAAAAAA